MLILSRMKLICLIAYIETQFMAHREPRACITKIIRLLQYREIMVVCGEDDAELINTECGQSAHI
jgi:hypothetical protein